MTCNRHIWHTNLFMSIWNNSFIKTCLTHVTNKCSFYFRFVKHLLNPTYILNFKKKKWIITKLISDIIINWNFTNPRFLNAINPKSLNLLIICWIVLYYFFFFLMWVEDLEVYALIWNVNNLFLYECYIILNELKWVMSYSNQPNITCFLSMSSGSNPINPLQ